MAGDEKVGMTVGINIESNTNKTVKDIERLNKELEALTKGYKKVSESTSALDSKSKQFKQQIKEISTEIHKLSSEAGKYIQTLNSAGGKVSKSVFKTDKHGNHSYSYNSKNPTESANAVRVISSQINLDAAITDQIRAQTKYQIERTKNLKKILDIEHATAAASADNAAAMKEREKLRGSSGYYSSVTALNRQRALNYKERTGAEIRLRNARAQRYEFLNAHPELTTPLRYQGRYQVSRGFNNLGSRLTSHGTAGFVAGGLLKTVGATLLGTVGGLVTGISMAVQGIGKFTSASLKAASEMEMLKTNLGVVYGSQTEASSTFSEIAQYAVKSPYGIQQTTEMAVLLKQSGVYASELMDTLKMIGDTSGGNAEKMKRIANNYAQITSIGKASMLDMRQFAYAGIPIYREVSKELGVSQAQLRKMISEGKVTSDIIEKVFKNITGINGLFENATEKGAKTFKARLQNLKDMKQLALASVGDNILNIGEKSGGDSVIYNGLGWAEDFFEKMKNWGVLKNLEHDVHLIQERDSQSEYLKRLIEYNKGRGNDDTVLILEQQLKNLETLSSTDANRATLSTLYHHKNDSLEALLKRYNVETTAELLKVVSDEEYRSQYEVQRGTIISDPEKLKDVDIKEALYKAAKEMSKASKEAVKAYESITKEERIAALEEQLLKSQQAAADAIEKAASRTGSYLNTVSELEMEYQNSDPGRAKAEAEKEARYEEAHQIAKEMGNYLREDGTVDIRNMDLKKLLEYTEKGVFRFVEKLQIVKGDKALTQENRKRVTENIKDLRDDLLGLLNSQFVNYSYEPLNEIFAPFASNTLSDSEFFNAMLTLEEKLEKITKNLSPENKKIFDKRLLFAFNDYDTETDLKPYIKDKSGGAANTFVPLWKRILSQSLDIPTEAIKKTTDTFDFYRDDLQKRRRASSVLEAAALSDSLSISQIQQLTGKRNRKTVLQGDSGETYQIDWESVNKDIETFAKRLSSSTKVVESWKTSLEEEYDTLMKLASSGLLQNETQGITQLTSTEAANLYRSFNSVGDVGVNAFGEKLKGIVDGKEVQLHFNDFGQLMDENNNAYKGEVTIEGNIYDEIKKTLPEIVKKLGEANETLLKNQTYQYLHEKNYTNTLLEESFDINPQSLFDKNDDYDRFNKTMISLADNQLHFQRKIKGVKEGEEFDWDAAYRTHKPVEWEAPDWRTPLSNSSTDWEAVAMQLAINPEFLTKGVDEILKGWLEDNKSTGSTITLPFENLQEFYDAYDGNLAAKTAPGRTWEKDINYSSEDLQSFAHSLAQLATKIMFSRAGDVTNKDVKTAYEEAKWGDVKKKENDLILSFKADSFVETDKDGDFNFDWSKLLNREVRKDKDGNDIYKEIDWLGGRFLDRKVLAAAGIDSNVSLDSDDKIIEKEKRMNVAALAARKTLIELEDGFMNITGDAFEKALVSPFEALGRSIREAAEGLNGFEDFGSNLGNSLAAITDGLMQQMGPLMTNAGFALVEAGAVGRDWAMIAAGLGLVAAGGIVQGLGIAPEDKSKKDNRSESDKEYERLNDLKDQLAELLRQARSDALYYEKNLRHKTALGINREFSYQSVNDAVITPSGDVISTHPDDYLIATKTPDTLMSNRAAAQPQITFKVINNAGSEVKVRQESKSNDDGTFEAVATIESIVGEFISSSKSDDAFSAREARFAGVQSIM